MDIYELLRQKHKIVFCRLEKIYADCDLGTAEIRIDLKKNTNPARSYIHELIHLKHKEMSETEVLKLERKVWRKARQFERFYVYRTLFKRGKYQ